VKKKNNARKNIKIAHVLKSSVYSGAENVVLTIIRELWDEFEFVYIATDGLIRKKLEEENVPFILLEKFTRRDLARAVRYFSPDIIHAHDFSATVLCALLPGRFRLISHLHYDPPWVRKWNLRTLAYWGISYRIESVLAVSESSFRHMVFSKRLLLKYELVGNPVNASRIQMLAQEWDESVEHASGNREGETCCDLLFVGRLVEQKNPQRFIRLVGELRDRGWTDIRAWMLGIGELKEECKKMIQNLKLDKQIEIMGYKDNPYPCMKRSGILCITSRWEGFGLVAIEANILGVPVISTDNSGCTDIFGQDAAEICRTDKEFSDRLLMLRQSKEEYALWKKRALQRGERFNNTDSYMKKLIKVYMGE